MSFIFLLFCIFSAIFYSFHYKNLSKLGYSRPREKHPFSRYQKIKPENSSFIPVNGSPYFVNRSGLIFAYLSGKRSFTDAEDFCRFPHPSTRMDEGNLTHFRRSLSYKYIYLCSPTSSKTLPQTS